MGLFFYARVWYRTFLSYHFENGITVPKNHVDRAHTVGAGHEKQEPSPAKRRGGDTLETKYLRLCPE